MLDVGCGPGRHSLEFARRGFDVTGVDISAAFVDLATTAAEAANLDNCRFVRGDARRLGEVPEIEAGSFDLVISLCQGAFGLTGGPAAAEGAANDFELDEPILAAVTAATRPGGSVVVSAFSSYFQVRHIDPTHPSVSAPDGAPPSSFDAESGVHHEWTSIMDADGRSESAELWTTCYTPRELRLLARVVGLSTVGVYGVTPGGYGPHEPSIACEEFLLVAKRPR